MCGIAGLCRLDGVTADLESVILAQERLAHRGPDDAGQWASGPIAFGFRRLSILDLEHGHQPMHSSDGRLTIVFNGEIYNHPQLKKELESQGVRYRTRSDTETLLHLYEREGEGMLRRLEGMFAIALWDARKRELMLARDPLGVKPLYYHFDGKVLAFASELRALAVWAPSQLDPAAILDYLCYGFVHGPKTVLSSAFKLLPGHFLRFNSDGIKLQAYWEAPCRAAISSPKHIEPDSVALDRVEQLLTDSVRKQMLSDVPVGAFLSGGVDSSLVAALMTKITGQAVPTFSIGFSGARAGLDESAYARIVARHLGCDHQELILPADVLNQVERLAECLDEPLADSAILPTYLLAEFARQKVKVVLTGEGADELFAGYGRYKAAYLSERLSQAPRWGSWLGSMLARRLGRGALFQDFPIAGLRSWAQANAHCGYIPLQEVLQRKFWDSASSSDPLAWLKDPNSPHSLNGALLFDLQTVLCDCLLMKVDKATMRTGLEARVPYLDQSLVHYALHLPARSKVRRFKGKYLLRILAEKYLPREIAWRRKHGFIVPWEEWVRSPKSRTIDDILLDGSLSEPGIFNMERLRRMLKELRDGRRHVDAGLFFRIAVLGLWLQSLKKGYARVC